MVIFIGPKSQKILTKNPYFDQKSENFQICEMLVIKVFEGPESNGGVYFADKRRFGVTRGCSCRKIQNFKKLKFSTSIAFLAGTWQLSAHSKFFVRFPILMPICRTEGAFLCSQSLHALRLGAYVLMFLAHENCRSCMQ